MNLQRNEDLSDIPNLDIRRSAFPRNQKHLTSMTAGGLYPLYVDSDIMPGDTVSTKIGGVIRQLTPLVPVMDNAFIDYYAFFVPHRLVWDHWKQMWGETDKPWKQDVEYRVPQIIPPDIGWNSGSIACYMGLPMYKKHKPVSALPFRAYCKIWNDWFRSTITDNALYYPTGDADVQGQSFTDGSQAGWLNETGNELNTYLGGFRPTLVNKPFDYFTGANIEPQRGPEVTIPIGTYAPVIAREENGLPVNIDTTLLKAPNILQLNGNPLPGTEISHDLEAYASPAIGASKMTYSEGTISGSTQYAALGNLWASIADTQTQTINALRQAFSIQKYYEVLGISGNRYISIIEGLFGVKSSDARMQRAEFLGGCRVPLNQTQVVQTSASDQAGTETPQGNVAAFGYTPHSDYLFSKSFEEHGTLMICACIRTKHSYQQGYEKMWNRKNKFDFYNPLFANLGYQPIYNFEIYADGTNKDLEVFGYNEAWEDMRTRIDHISGMMNSVYPQALDQWHYADYYQELPKLDSEWLKETRVNIDRTIAVSGKVDQYECDFYFENEYIRPMPVFSRPGLIDHP